MQSPALVDRIVDFARTVSPLLEWGWAAADDQVPPPPPIRKLAGRCRNPISSRLGSERTGNQ
jgi:hypothetical protein